MKFDFLANILNRMPIALCLVNQDGKIYFRNNRFVEIFGYTEADVPDLNSWWRNAYPDPYYREQVINTWQRVVREACEKNTDIQALEYQVTAKNGRKGTYEISGIIIADEFIATFIDLTQRVKLEQELRFAVAMANHANQELREFAYVASHDLQEPLRTMNSYVEFLREDLGPVILNEAAQEDLRFISEAALRMQNLVRDLLSYSRSGQLEVKNHPVALDNCLTIVQENLLASIEESSASLTWRDLPIVRGDATSLISVFQNLCSNSIKFRRPNIAPHIEITAQANDNFWIITITDNGIGIEKKYLEQIFLPFKRLHSNKDYPGAGLGLSIVKKIIERHNGCIQVNSILGQGTTFTLKLPAWQENQAPE